MLSDYGQYCSEEGGNLHDYSETLNAVVAGRPAWRRATAKAWRVVRAWCSLVPLRSHRPMPMPVLLAMQALALSWGEIRMCAALGLGFLGLLRPAELLKLTGKSLVTPPHLMYIDIVRVEDSIFVPFVEKIKEQLGPEEQLWPMRGYGFRLSWDSLLKELGVPIGQHAGLTPASLRSGGATHMFPMTHDVQLVRWRGRWQHTTTLEHYLQGVGTAFIVPALAPVARAAICRWATRAHADVPRFATMP